MSRKMKKQKQAEQRIEQSTQATDDIRYIEDMQVQAGLLSEFGLDIIARKIRLTGVVNNRMARRLNTAMSILEGNPDLPITITINSPGGSVFSGDEMIARISTSPCEVTTEAVGVCMSMGIFIFAAGDIRRTHTLCEFMHHEGSGGLDSTRTSEMARKLQAQEKHERMHDSWLDKRTGKEEGFWANIGTAARGGDYHFFASEAVSCGLAHETFE